MNLQQFTDLTFTLMELVMVIVVISILAVVAIPTYIDLTGQAAQSVVTGTAGALSSTNSMNYAGCSSTAQRPITGICTAINACADLAALLNPALPIVAYAADTTEPVGTFAIANDATLAAASSPADGTSYTACTLYYYKLAGKGSDAINTVSATFTVTITGHTPIT